MPDAGPFHKTLTSSVFQTWGKLQALEKSSKPAIDGQKLDVTSVVAAARHGLAARIDDDPLLRRRLDESIRVLKNHLYHSAPSRPGPIRTCACTAP